jgi:osmotically-inducible protein OsmY
MSAGSTNIHVNCIDGTVALSGEVQNTDLMAVAEQAASGVTGVTGIVNNLKVRPSPGS